MAVDCFLKRTLHSIETPFYLIVFFIGGIDFSEAPIRHTALPIGGILAQ